MFAIADLKGLDVVFGPSSMDGVLPTLPEIPGEFKCYGNKWVKLFEDWFFAGLKKLDLVPKDGVDKTKAMVHIRAVMGSFASAHEHKTAGVAFLLSEWFKSAKWERKDGRDGAQAI